MAFAVIHAKKQNRESRIQEFERKFRHQTGVIAEPQGNLGLNCSKPPSIDGLWSTLASKRDNRKGQKSGGKNDHKGYILFRSYKPDQIKNHFRHNCPNYGYTLDEVVSDRVVIRQAINIPELPPPSPLLAGHLTHTFVRTHCRVEADTLIQRVSCPLSSLSQIDGTGGLNE